jgi:hypothetical protein
MTKTAPADDLNETGKLTAGSFFPRQALDLTLIYEDAASRQWAMQECDREANLLKRECLFSNSWRLTDLAQPEAFQDAVLAAIWSDVIIVSVCANGSEPIDLYVWVDAWLPRRCRRPGALMALIRADEPSGLFSSHLRQYLRAVARRGELEYLVQERTQPQRNSSQAYHERVADQAHATTHTLRRVLKAGLAPACQ